MDKEKENRPRYFGENVEERKRKQKIGKILYIIFLLSFIIMIMILAGWAM